MGVSVIPIISSIVVSMLVSKAVQALGPKLGLSDSMTGIAATVGGMYAGGMTYGAMQPTAAASTTTATEIGAQSTPSALSAAGSDIAPSWGGATNPTGTGFLGQAGAQPGGVSPLPSPGGARPGLAAPALASPPPPPPPPAPVVAPPVTPPPVPKQSWFDKLMASDKAWDMGMAAFGGAGEAGMADKKMRYQEDEIDKPNARAWEKADPNGGGYLTLGRGYPSQQRGQ